MKLTQLAINTNIQKAKESKRPVKLSDGGGLYLFINSFAKSASWRYNYRLQGKQKTHTIGKYPEYTLKEAREQHNSAHKLVSQGIDPSVEKKRLKALKTTANSNTFYRITLDWHSNQAISWSEDHARNVLHQLEKDIFPFIGRIPITELTPLDASEVIKKIQARGANDYASRCLQRIINIMNYAVRLGIIPFNSCLSLSGIVKLPPTEHQPALPQNELQEFFKRLGDEPAFPLTKLALLFTVITFVRIGSLRTMEWGDINFEKQEWLIPKEKFKSKRKDFIVPLSDWALEILKHLYDQSRLKKGYVFHKYNDINKPMSENALSYLMGRMGYNGIATPHGFRSLATDVLNENNFKPDIIERQMGHIEKNSVRRAYHRTEYLSERKTMMQWYSDWIRERYSLAKQEAKNTSQVF